MPNCKRCKSSFHYCSNCEIDIIADYGYCGEECFKDSVGYLISEAMNQKMYEKLNGYLLLYKDKYNNIIFLGCFSNKKEMLSKIKKTEEQMKNFIIYKIKKI